MASSLQEPMQQNQQQPPEPGLVLFEFIPSTYGLDQQTVPNTLSKRGRFLTVGSFPLRYVSVLENEPIQILQNYDAEWTLIRNARREIGLVPSTYLLPTKDLFSQVQKRQRSATSLLVQSTSADDESSASSATLTSKNCDAPPPPPLRMTVQISAQAGVLESSSALPIILVDNVSSQHQQVLAEDTAPAVEENVAPPLPPKRVTCRSTRPVTMENNFAPALVYNNHPTRCPSSIVPTPTTSTTNVTKFDKSVNFTTDQLFVRQNSILRHLCGQVQPVMKMFYEFSKSEEQFLCQMSTLCNKLNTITELQQHDVIESLRPLLNVCARLLAVCPVTQQPLLASKVELEYSLSSLERFLHTFVDTKDQRNVAYRCYARTLWSMREAASQNALNESGRLLLHDAHYAQQPLERLNQHCILLRRLYDIGLSVAQIKPSLLQLMLRAYRNALDTYNGAVHLEQNGFDDAVAEIDDGSIDQSHEQRFSPASETTSPTATRIRRFSLPVTDFALNNDLVTRHENDQKKIVTVISSSPIVPAADVAWVTPQPPNRYRQQLLPHEAYNASNPIQRVHGTDVCKRDMSKRATIAGRVSPQQQQQMYASQTQAPATRQAGHCGAFSASPLRVHGGFWRKLRKGFSKLVH